MSNNDTFQWDEKSALKFAEFYSVMKDFHKDKSDCLDTFIDMYTSLNASHTQQEPERIEVRNFYHECHVVKGHEYVVEVSGSIDPTKFPSIKEAIEKVINEQLDSRYDGLKSNMVKLDEHGQWEEPKRDWEILEYLYSGEVWQKVVYSQNGGYRWGNGLDRISDTKMGLSESKTIHSVRRLSDNTVFSIGDKIDHRESDRCKWKNDPSKILSFSVSGEMLIATFMSDEETSPTGDISREICDIKKLPPKPQILFTTDDGVDIHQGYEGKIWRVFIKPHSFDMWKPYEIGMPQYINSAEEKYFSTEAAAKEFCVMNKPCLSVNDILALWPLSPEPKNAIADLAKFKQKQPTT